MERGTRRLKGLILAFTGDGKGKTTAALGTALRMIARGGKVGIVQFFKPVTGNGKPHRGLGEDTRRGMGEIKALEKFGSLFKVWNFGGGFTWQVAREANAEAVLKAWDKCRELLRDPKYDLVIFDEIHIALKYKFLKASEVVKALKARVPSRHVILTGQGAPKSILKIADLVTEMKCLKHPFLGGIPAQPGLDF